MGEYPLAWSAFLCNEGLYNLLLMKGADPDAQDTYGNTVLHMVVVGSQLGMYGYALRHPKKCGNPYIKNNRGLTPLTLSCELGRDEIFKYNFQSKNNSSIFTSSEQCWSCPVQSSGDIPTSHVVVTHWVHWTLSRQTGTQVIF